MPLKDREAYDTADASCARKLNLTTLGNTTNAKNLGVNIMSGPKIVAVIFLILMGLGAVSLVSSVIGRGAELVDKTFDADNIIYNYEQFQRDAQNVRQFETAYQTAKQAYDSFREELGDDRSSWAQSDRDELNVLRSAMIGNKAERNRLAAEYNAKSQMLNRDLFKSDNLPHSFTMIP